LTGYEGFSLAKYQVEFSFSSELIHTALYYGFAYGWNKTDSDLIAGHSIFGISDTKTMKNVNKGERERNQIIIGSLCTDQVTNTRTSNQSFCLHAFLYVTATE